MKTIRMLALLGASAAALSAVGPSAAAQGVQARPALSQAGPRVVATPVAPVPGNPDFKAEDGVKVPPPPPLPPAIWDPVSVQDLVYFIRQVGAEGLEPSFYDPQGLEAALRTGNPAYYSDAATERFNELASDLALGHVRKAARIDWHIVDKDLDNAARDTLLRTALAKRGIAAALNGLLPTHPQYAALKTSLQLTPEAEKAKRDRIRLNMDRWRWLPRDLGDKYVIVNVPGFHATLVENGVNRWKHKAIAGATKTPTPQLAVLATGVMVNPWWEVPPSITREVAGKAGYVKSSDGSRWRQPPGPRNALGEMKFVMYNPQNIYLHDTNARSRFAGRMRALSHGCIRTENIHDLAMELLADDGGEWTPDKVEAQIASGKTKQLNFAKPVPVYIVYFSVAALNDGQIVDYQDLYSRDGKAMAALYARDGGAAKPKAPAPKVASR